MPYIHYSTEGGIDGYTLLALPEPNDGAWVEVGEDDAEVQAYLAPAVSAIAGVYRWLDLKAGLRGTDLFAIAYDNSSAYTTMLDAFSSTEDTNENRFADFSFAVKTIAGQYSQEQRDRFSRLLGDCGFPAIEFAMIPV